MAAHPPDGDVAARGRFLTGGITSGRTRALCQLLERLGFEVAKNRGSHRVFRREGVPRLVKLQATSNCKAKRYQVEEVLAIIDEHGLEV